jgi:hypothetical protein
MIIFWRMNRRGNAPRLVRFYYKDKEWAIPEEDCFEEPTRTLNLVQGKFALRGKEIYLTNMKGEVVVLNRGELSQGDIKQTGTHNYRIRKGALPQHRGENSTASVIDLTDEPYSEPIARPKARSHGPKANSPLAGLRNVGPKTNLIVSPTLNVERKARLPPDSEASSQMALNTSPKASPPLDPKAGTSLSPSNTGLKASPVLGPEDSPRMALDASPAMDHQEEARRPENLVIANSSGSEEISTSLFVSRLLLTFS